jgi:hypothetical protein
VHFFLHFAVSFKRRAGYAKEHLVCVNALTVIMSGARTIKKARFGSHIMQIQKLLQVVLIGALMALSLYAQQAQTPPLFAKGIWNWTGGSGRTMIISDNGTIALSTGGTTTYGVYSLGKIYLNGNASTLAYLGNQKIHTVNQSTNEASDYTRVAWNGPVQTENAPNRLAGTWYWLNGGDRTMIVESTGHVTLVSGGQISEGRYFNDAIELNGSASTITQVGSHIRTYNPSNGENSDYSRIPNDSITQPSGPVAVPDVPPTWSVGNWLRLDATTQRVLKIEADGKITIIENNQKSYGTYSLGVINIENTKLKLIKNGTQLQTHNEKNGNVVDYKRVLTIPNIPKKI